MLNNHYNNSKFLAYKFRNKLLLWGNIESIPDYLYIVELIDYSDKRFIKIGITNEINKRINQISKNYKNYKILLEKKLPKAQEIETAFKQKFINYRAKKITTIVSDKKKLINVPSPTETFIYEDVITKINELIKESKNIEVVSKIKELNIGILNNHYKQVYKRLIVKKPETVELIFLNFEVGKKYLIKDIKGKICKWYIIKQDDSFNKLFTELLRKYKNTKFEDGLKYYKKKLYRNQKLSEKQLKWLDNEFNKL